MRTRPVDIQKDIINPIILSFAVFFSGLVLSIGAWSLARNYETQLFPVIQDFRITAPRVTNDHLVFSPYFVKLRDCEFAGMSWYVRLTDDTLRQVYIGYPRNLSGDQSAPVGAQVRPDVEVGQKEWPEAVNQFGFIYHDCLGYKIRTKVGPFPIYN